MRQRGETERDETQREMKDRKIETKIEMRQRVEGDKTDRKRQNQR